MHHFWNHLRTGRVSRRKAVYVCSMRVFVVDDDPDFCSMLRRVLMGDGHEVITAERGAEALMRALSEEFDLLICDLMLPDLHGTEVIRAIKAQSPDLPVMVVSALNPDEWRGKCLDAGASGYLQKPLRLEDLRDEVAMVESGRPNLRAWIVDADDLHRARLRRELRAQGCRVESFTEATAALNAANATAEKPHVLLVDAALEGAIALIKSQPASAAVTFGDDVERAREEALLRAGAALCMSKPVDVEQLMIQVRFLAHA